MNHRLLLLLFVSFFLKCTAVVVRGESRCCCVNRKHFGMLRRRVSSMATLCVPSLCNPLVSSPAPALPPSELLRTLRSSHAVSAHVVARRFCASFTPPPPRDPKEKASQPNEPSGERASTETTNGPSTPPAAAPSQQGEVQVGVADAEKPSDPAAPSSGTPPPAAPLSNASAVSATPQQNPKGFARFYAPHFLSRIEIYADPSQAIKNARHVTAEEREIMLSAEEYATRMRHYKRLAIVGTLVGGLLLYRTYRDWQLKVGDTSSYSSVVVYINDHLAQFYDALGNVVAYRSYVDFRAFELTVGSDKDVMIAVSTYYPFVPMLLLLLLPFMSGLNSGFSMSARMAAKHAREGLANEKGKFRFKREVGVATRLDDVAGLTEAKHEVVEVVDFLKNPERYRRLGAKLPKGVLLDGPPGVGKTLLAKAVAGEAMVPFLSCSGSEFEEVFVGVGAQRVRELFKQAHKSKPCVVFIDEIDAFGKKRKSDGGGSSRSTLNAFLSELDGFHDASGIIVLAATNRADVLDNALTRSGRFDRKITLEKPPHKDRVAISMVHLRPLKLDPAVPIESFAETLASLTGGCSGADIYNICNEAAIVASRENRDSVNVACFHKALERVLVGLEKKAFQMQKHEKERMAHHEAGHVVLSWFQDTTDPVIKTTISPRGGNMTGVTQKLPQTVYISTQQRIRESMIARLGGFVAEEYFFKDLSTNAADDLQRVTDMARDEICVYGMSPHTIGHFGYKMDQENAIQKPYGPKRENQIDLEISGIVEDCAHKARELLQKHILEVRKVAGLLMKHETLSAHELWLLLGDRPVMSEEFRKYLQN